jgi:hypothetical protein
MISGLCFLAGCAIGWLAHRAEVEHDRRRSEALAKVFDDRRAK